MKDLDRRGPSTGLVKMVRKADSSRASFLTVRALRLCLRKPSIKGTSRLGLPENHPPQEKEKNLRLADLQGGGGEPWYDTLQLNPGGEKK